MSLDARRAELWHAMQLGPLWSWRSSSLSSSTAELSSSTESLAAAAPVIFSPERSNAINQVVVAEDSPQQRVEQLDWDDLRTQVAQCRACGLCQSRKQTVFGVGSTQARWLLVGEAPGAEEDARGEPFVGQAGKLLDNMLAALGLDRQASGAQGVYIANVLKCRPPGNRNPEPEEVAKCEPFLKRQVALLQPTLIVVMGRFAAQSLLGTEASIASLRGKAHQYEVDGRSVPVVVTYHPAYLLRNLADKSKSWADLCLASKIFGQA